jgi:hypothetical protein
MLGHLGYQAALAHMNELRASADHANRRGRSAGREGAPSRRQRQLLGGARVPQAATRRLA